MAWLLALVGLVAAVQGAAWANEGDARPRGRALIGVFLAPAGLLALGLGVLGALVPEVWSG